MADQPSIQRYSTLSNTIIVSSPTLSHTIYQYQTGDEWEGDSTEERSIEAEQESVEALEEGYRYIYL